ncbi:hypothetical protein R1sor_018620 [Riccia sorocarpa]|uniref:Large ribosomal subunit protein uL5 C-terminal domain-containing protein n=1 Tax=Riccia sorocarpa TaxID=122646 RepID=A0ABD3IA69_9MARC
MLVGSILGEIVVSCGIGEAAQNTKSLESTRPVRTIAQKAIAGFKLREGVPVGFELQLTRRDHAFLLDRLKNLALPQTRDFQEVNAYSFDGKGNYIDGTEVGGKSASALKKSSKARSEFRGGKRKVE